MPTYTAKDNETGKKITFNWNGDIPPTDTDMEEVFSQAKDEVPQAFPQEISSMPPVEGAIDVPPPIEGMAAHLPAAGAAVGGLLGSGVASIPLAAAGGIIGKGAEQLLTGKPLNATEIGMEGAWQGGIQAAGLGAARVIGKVAAPLAKKLSPKIGEVIEFFKKYGGEFSPAQVTESKLMDTVEEMAEGAVFGRETMTKFRAGQKEAIGRIVDDLSNNIGTKLDPADIGRIALDAIEGNFKAFNRTAKVMYGEVDALSKGAIVSTSGVKEFAKEQASIATARKGIGGSQAGDGLLKKVLELPDTMTFKEAQSLRSGFWDELQSASATKDKAAGLAKKFLSLTDDAMEISAKGLGGDAYQAWRAANNFYKTNKETFRTQLIVRLSKDNPEIIVDQVFKPGRISSIQKVREALKDTPEAWEQLRGAYFNKLLTQSSDDVGALIGIKLSNNLNKMGDPMLNEIFGGHAKNLNLLAQAAKTAQTKVGGSGGMLIQLMQGSAFGTLIALKYPTSGVSVLIGPHAAAKLVTSDSGIHWLTKGMTIPGNTSDAIATATRIMRELGSGRDVAVRFPLVNKEPDTPLTNKYLSQ